MNRKRKLLYNTTFGLIEQAIALVCGFILPRLFLVTYGSAVNGLISTITRYLGLISLLDLGVGSVVQASMYKPLADNDTVQLSKVFKSTVKFFRRLACIFIAYVIVLAFVFPLFIDKENDFFFSFSLVIILSLGTLAQYMFGISYQKLLSADQKGYISMSMSIISIIINTVLSVLLIELGASIQVVKFVSALVYILKPFVLFLYIKKNYKIDRKVVLTEEPIKQKWNGFSQHISSVVCDNVDVVLLSFFSTMENISVYSVYSMVTNGVQKIIMSAVSGLESLYGNLIAKNEKSKLLSTFVSVEWTVHFSVTIIYTIAAITITPFVSVYTSDVTDVDYNVPLFGALLTIAYSVMCLRVPYFRLIKAAGHFKETQNGAFVSAGLNVVVSFVFIFKFGLIGVAAGTFIALFYHTCYFAWYLRKNIINRPIKYFIKYLITDSLTGALTYFVCRNFSMSDVSYPSWIKYAAEVSLTTIAIAVFLNILLYFRIIKSTLGLIISKNKKAKEIKNTEALNRKES